MVSQPKILAVSEHDPPHEIAVRRVHTCTVKHGDAVVPRASLWFGQAGRGARINHPDDR